MTNPYESPLSPFGPDEAPLTGRSCGIVVAGFLAAMVATLFGTIVALAFGGQIASHLPDALEGTILFLCSPAVVGPFFGAFFWWLTRRSYRSFAMGAVVFGVAAFLLFGGCFMVVSMT